MINYSDLDKRAYNNSQYIFTDFITLSEQEDFYKESSSFLVPYALYGGYENAERKIARFGSEDYFGYEVPYPIVCLKITPIAKKFAKEVSHRDFLGSLMGLGLERKCFGDIIVDGTSAYVFVVERVAEYVIENLISIGRNTVKTEICEFDENAANADGTEATLQVASLRCDAIIAAAFHLSRKDSAALFFEKRIAVNGRLTENNDHTITGCATISVRGYGKVQITDIGGITRKGKTVLTAVIYK